MTGAGQVTIYYPFNASLSHAAADAARELHLTFLPSRRPLSRAARRVADRPTVFSGRSGRSYIRGLTAHLNSECAGAPTDRPTDFAVRVACWRQC